jgi:hypothetical protein
MKDSGWVDGLEKMRGNTRDAERENSWVQAKKD